jgi:hypothetical protein
MRRITWTVRPEKIGWNVVRDDKALYWFLWKFRAVAFARRRCNFELQHYHQPSELMIADRKGRYTAEGSTYGNDPRNIPG